MIIRFAQLSEHVFEVVFLATNSLLHLSQIFTTLILLLIVFTTALFCAILHYYKKNSEDRVNGMIYPSPMVYGDTVNIIMMPNAVNEYLIADDCFIFKYVRGLNNK